MPGPVDKEIRELVELFTSAGTRRRSDAFAIATSMRMSSVRTRTSPEERSVTITSQLAGK